MTFNPFSFENEINSCSVCVDLGLNPSERIKSSISCVFKTLGSNKSFPDKVSHSDFAISGLSKHSRNVMTLPFSRSVFKNGDLHFISVRITSLFPKNSRLYCLHCFCLSYPVNDQVLLWKEILSLKNCSIYNRGAYNLLSHTK